MEAIRIYDTRMAIQSPSGVTWEAFGEPRRTKEMASKHRDDKRGNGAYRRIDNDENEKCC